MYMYVCRLEAHSLSYVHIYIYTYLFIYLFICLLFIYLFIQVNKNKPIRSNPNCLRYLQIFSTPIYLYLYIYTYPYVFFRTPSRKRWYGFSPGFPYGKLCMTCVAPNCLQAKPGALGSGNLETSQSFPFFLQTAANSSHV